MYCTNHNIISSHPLRINPRFVPSIDSLLLTTVQVLTSLPSSCLVSVGFYLLLQMDLRLKKAAMIGDLQGLARLLEEQPLLLDMILPPFSENPLHIAALTGQTELGRKLVSYRCELATERTGPGDQTPLHIAAGAGHAEFVNMLVLELGKNSIMEGDHQNNTPLHYAAAKGKVDVIKCLIAKNSQVIKSKNYNGETPIHFAKRSRHVEALEVMIKCLKELSDADLELMHTPAVDGSSVSYPATAARQNQSLVWTTNGQQEGNPISNSEAAVHVIPVESDLDGMSRVGRRREVGDGKKADPLISTEDTLRVVGSMISSITFQAAVNPPPALWKGHTNSSLTFTEFRKCNIWDYTEKCKEASLATFMLTNVISFMGSLSLLVYYYNSCAATFFLNTSIAFLLFTYYILMVAISPAKWISYTTTFGLAFLFSCFFLDLLYRRCKFWFTRVQWSHLLCWRCVFWVKREQRPPAESLPRPGIKHQAAQN